MVSQISQRNNYIDQAIGLTREKKQELQKELLQKRDELEQMKSKNKLELQALNFEHERMTRKQDHLTET